MSRRWAYSVLLGAVAAIQMLVNASTAGAMGYWNLPGNCCQWLGCGYSGGYHAPYVLGPINGGCCEAWNEVRMPYPPNPYACAPCYSGSGGSGCGADGPTVMPAEPQPATAPQAVAPSAARQIIFIAPVQR
jgi:hypothetical protein